MPSTTSYDFGDVVLVSFPFTNLQATKKRPAVIISRQAYQQNRPDVILMAITSQIRQPLATGEVILHDWQAAGLAKPSMLKPLIATLEQNQIVKRMGQLSAVDRESLGKVIQAILGA
jgi:mRNA-degrading endonuclease toxin of MazEF toxin-antitoxin module